MVLGMIFVKVLAIGRTLVHLQELFREPKLGYSLVSLNPFGGRSLFQVQSNFKIEESTIQLINTTALLFFQILIPHMQSGAAKEIRGSMNSLISKVYRRTASSDNEERGSYSSELWKKAFKDACERICPVRAGGHECGCLRFLSKLVLAGTLSFNVYFA